MTKRGKIVVTSLVVFFVAAAAVVAYFVTRIERRPRKTIEITAGPAAKAPEKEAEPELRVLVHSPEGRGVPITNDGVTVMFNKAVVPLTTLDEGRDRAIDIAITPKIAGKFFWLGTHGFIFRPQEGFDPATTYHVSIPAGIAALDGSVLNKPVEWDFSTVRPKVLGWRPSVWKDSPTLLLPGNALVLIKFNLSMNRGDVEKKFSISSADGDLSGIKKVFKWSDDDHILRVSFPENLPWGVNLQMTIPKGTRARKGNLGVVSDITANYQTPGPQLLVERVFRSDDSSEQPLSSDKEEGITFKSGVCYKFSQPIKQNSFEKAFSAQMEGSGKKPETNYFYSYSEYFFLPAAVGNKETVVEGVRKACAVFADEHNQRYSFSIVPDRIKALSGAPLTSDVVGYIVRTPHATANIRANLTKNIISLNRPVFVPYTLTNVGGVTIRLYAVEGADYEENVKGENFRGLREHYDEKLRKSVADDPPMGRLGYLNYYLPVDTKTMTIDQERVKPFAVKDIPVTAEMDKPFKLKLDLSQLFEGGRLIPGTYLIEATGNPLIKDGTKPKATYSMIQVTPVALALKREVDHILVWATDIETGTPIKNLQVTVWSEDGNPKGEDAVTNDDGVAMFKPSSKKVCAEVKKEDARALVCEDMHRIASHWPMRHSKNLFAYIYTDRPIYRPGQTIFFSSFVREVREGRYFLPEPDTECTATIKDSKGDEIYSNKSEITRGGIVSGSFQLSDREDMPRGEYRISIGCLEQTFTRKLIVTSYRKPSFKVDVKSDTTELSSQEELSAMVLGSYFFGAPLKKAKTNWSIMTQTHIFSPEGFESFSFIDDDLLNEKGGLLADEWEIEDYYYSDYEYDIVATSVSSEDRRFWTDDPRGGAARQDETELFEDPKGEGVSVANELDDLGSLTIKYKPNLAKYPTSQKLTLEASVTDPSNQEVSAFQDFVVHKAEYYLGLKPQRWAYGEGEEVNIEAVSLDTKGKPVGGKKFSVVVLSREYKFSERLTTDGGWDWIFAPKDTKLKTLEAVTDPDGKAVVGFQIPKGGEYRFVAKAQDAKGNSIQSAATIFAWGKNFVPWRMDKPTDLGLLPDKDSYKVGETAHILIKSLVPATKAIMTLERGRIIEYKVIELDSNASHIEVPITEGMIPNIFVSVVAHAGREGNRPPFILSGETELHVEPETKRLQVSVIPDRKGEGEEPPSYRPGDEVGVRLETKDAGGKPIKAHVIVSVADESVLRLLDYKLPDLVKKFYFLRPNMVTASSSLISLKAGDDGIATDKKRRVFKDTAHFEAHIETNDKGVANFKFKLPDDLTTWVIEALAITESKTYPDFEKEMENAKSQTPKGQLAVGADLALSDSTFVGGARGAIMTSLPLSLRTGLPRFAAWDDKVRGKVIVNNKETKPIEGRLKLNISGDGQFSGGLRQKEIPFSVGAKLESSYIVDIDVLRGEGRLVFSAEARDNGGHVLDGIETLVPVLDRYAPEVVATSGISRGQEREQLLIPKDINQDMGGLGISLKASLGLIAANAMKDLFDFELGCSEQRSSSLLALIFARDLIGKYGEGFFDSLAPVRKWEIPKGAGFRKKLGLLDAKIAKIISELTQRYQREDGGMAYWPDVGASSSFYPSVQVLWALNMAREFKFKVDEASYTRLEQYISTQLDRQTDISKGVIGLTNDMKAYGLWAISLDSGWNEDVGLSLSNASSDLSVSGLSFLLMAMKNHGGWDLNPIVARLYALADQTPRHTSWPSSGFFWSSAVKNTALAALGLTSHNPYDSFVPRAMKFLFNRKETSCPMCTQDNLYLSWFAYTIANTFDEEDTDFKATVAIAGKAYAEKSFDTDNIAEIYSTNVPMDKLMGIEMPTDMDLKREGQGTLYYDLVLKYYLPPETTPTREEGLIISREYYDLDDVKETRHLTEFVAGKTYKAHIVLTVPKELNYVIAEDLLPAGFEAMDMKLATTSRAAQIEARRGEEEQDRGVYVFDTRYDDVIKPIDFSSDFAFSHQEIRDDKILWSDQILPPGVYHIKYPVRATTAGRYLMSGATAYEFYEPEVFGRSRMRVVEIKER